jgi:hypothetical protein
MSIDKAIVSAFTHVLDGHPLNIRIALEKLSKKCAR